MAYSQTPPRAIVRSSPTKQSLLAEGTPQSEEKTSNVTAASKKRNTHSSSRQSSRRTRAFKNDEPSSQQTLASEADEPPSPVSRASEPNSESLSQVPEASETVTSRSHRATRQSTKRSTQDKKQRESEEGTIKLSPFQLSIEQPSPYSSSSPRVTETTAVASRRKPPSNSKRTYRVSGFISPSDDDTSASAAVKETRPSDSVSQSNHDNQETTKISEVARKKSRHSTSSSMTSTKRKRKRSRLNMPLPKRKSRVNVSRKSEQSIVAVGRPRKRQMKQHQIEETAVEQSQQLMSPERNDDMTDQEYETEQDGESWCSDFVRGYNLSCHIDQCLLHYPVAKQYPTV